MSSSDNNGHVQPSRSATRRLHATPGEMAECVRTHDWASSLGPIEAWNETLLATVSMMLSADIPVQLFWGPDMITLYNDALRPAFAEKHPHALGMSAREVWKEVWPDIGPQLENVLEGHSVRHRAVPFKLLRNGKLEEMYWDYSYSPIFLPDGSVAGILDVALDVTETVLAQQRLKASEAQSSQVAQQLSQVLAVTKDAVTGVNRDWVITYVNQAAEASYGSKSELIGRNIWEHYPDAVYEGSPFVEHLHRAMDGTSSGFEAFYPEPLNMWLQVEVHPTQDGIVIFSRDMTERRRAEQVLQKTELAAVRSEQQLKVIMDALPAYLSYLDTDFRYVRVNRTYEEWFKRSANEIVGLSIDDVLGMEAAGLVRAEMQHALRGERKQFEYKLNIHGEERTLNVVHLPDLDEKGTVRGVIVQGQDVTDRKRSEEALLQSEKLAAVGRLAASIAHEINNPLESVTNLLYLARQSQAIEEAQEYLDTAERELRRVSAITHQTLRFYRQSTKPRAVSSTDLLESVLSIYQGRLVNSHITVVEDRKTDELVECFDGEVRQVFNNLVANAIDAMHPLGGRLILRSRVSTNWSNGRQGIRITVADTGSGMPPGVLKRAFEAFYTTKGIGGNGLGLWVSAEIVKRHSGTLHVRSSRQDRHHGTVFTLFLPFDAAIRQALV